MTMMQPASKPKRKGLLAAVLIAVVLIAAAVAYYAYQSQNASGAAPTITHTSPIVDSTGTPINSKILVTFSKAMDPSTITNSTFTLQHAGSPDSGTVRYTGVAATFTPSASLVASTLYTAVITTGAKDASGHALAVQFVWSFTTGVLADTTAPTVISTSPVIAVAVGGTISATFSKAMDPSTISATTFTVTSGSGAVSYEGTTASFKPSTNLAANTAYTATITIGAKDLEGNALESNFVWQFTTATSASSCAPTAVPLGSAANFAVLGGSTVSNTGNTVVTGDVGVSPGTAIVGFPPGTASGTIWRGNNATAVAAEADLTTAYGDAAGRTLCPILVSGNLGGQTRAPGLYKSTSSLEISSGDLILDAGSNQNAVWIFQIQSTLTTTSGRQVILAGGAQAKNIFWQVGSSATLGTGSVFDGTIMAYASITITHGATLNGRALAQVGAVTLDTNTVTKPA